MLYTKGEILMKYTEMDLSALGEELKEVKKQYDIIARAKKARAKRKRVFT